MEVAKIQPNKRSSRLRLTRTPSTPRPLAHGFSMIAQTLNPNGRRLPGRKD